MKIHTLLFAGSLATGCFAQGKFELQPFAGARFGGTLRNSDNDPSPVSLPAATAAGVSLAYHFVPDFGLEFMWTTQKASGGINTQPSALRVNQFLGNLIFNVVPDHNDGWLRTNFYPFFLAGFGAVRTGGAGVGDTKYSYALGGGIKYFFSEHFGLRLQARYIIIHLYTTPNLGPPACNPVPYGYGSYCDASNNYESRQGDVTVGFVFRF